MNNPDILLEVCIRADMSVLGALYLSSLSEEVKSLLNSERFYQLRIQHLASKQITFACPPECSWKRTYFYLELTMQHNTENPLNGFMLEDELSVRVLLHLGYDPTLDNHIALENAVKRNIVAAVQLLLEDGRADPTKNNSEVLYAACVNNSAEIVRLLLSDGRADPTMYGGQCLRLVQKLGTTEIVELLLADPRMNA